MVIMKIFGHPVSQPSRAVMWLCMIHDLPFEMKEVDPIKGDTATDEFRIMNPAGIIPTIQDGDITLFESNAIMIYLAEKHNWTSWYPKSLYTRSKINQYMNWHHQNTRTSSLVFRSKLLLFMGMGTEEQKRTLIKGDRIISKFMTVLEIWLTASQFIASDDAPTLADIACYCELDQLVALNLFDFSPYPRVVKWIDYMSKLPKHEESHRSLNKLARMINSVPMNGAKL